VSVILNVPAGQQPIVQGSGDPKPLAGVPVGAVLHESDTGADFRFDGSRWVRDQNADPVLDRLETLTDVVGQLLRETVRLRLGLIGARMCHEVDAKDAESVLQELQSR
jgi:hypothetical protein